MTKEAISLLISEINPDSPEQIILNGLQQGDKNRGELLDLIGKSYLALVETLQHLTDRELIESLFAPIERISVLTYRPHFQT